MRIAGGRFPIVFVLFVALGFVCHVQSLIADTVRLVGTGGGVQVLENCHVDDISTISGNLSFQIKKTKDEFGFGEKVSSTQVESIDFGTAGKGRHFNLMVATNSGIKNFDDVLVLNYKAGVFLAAPQGSQPWPLQADRIQMVMPSMKDMMAEHSPPSAMDSETGTGNDTSSVARESSGIAPPPAASPTNVEFQRRSSTASRFWVIAVIGYLLLALQLVMAGISLLLYVLVLVHAMRSGQIVIGLIVFCFPPVSIWYALWRYDEPWGGFVRGMAKSWLGILVLTVLGVVLMPLLAMFLL